MCAAIAFKTGHSDTSLVWCCNGRQFVASHEPRSDRRRSWGKRPISPLESDAWAASLPFLFFLNLSKSDFKGGQAIEELDHLVPFSQRNMLSILLFLLLG